MTRARLLTAGALAAGIAAGLAACATNPATGRSQLMLISEAQELAIGREQDPAIVAQYGTSDDAELEAYVAGLGQRLAAVSERPDLQWRFRVLDDPVVNAFALPAHVYVTRGILAYMSNEAQLVGVLGHEIGHVTARHTAARLSKAQLAGVGLAVGGMLSEDVARLSGVAETGVGLLFLDFSRDDERQADSLGLRYMTREGYDPRELQQVFAILDRTSRSQAEGRLPGWLSTHPNPEDRIERIAAEIAERGLSGGTVGQAAFVQRLDGLVYGANPREGFFEGDAFYHPDMRFQLALPAGFRHQNTKQAVQSSSAKQDAALTLTLAEGSSADAAARAFFARSEVRGSGRRDTVNGLAAFSGAFEAASDGQTLRGHVVFVEHERRVLRLLAIATSAAWAGHERALVVAQRSIRPLTDRGRLAVQPARLEIVRLDAPLALREFARRWPSSVGIEELALLNGVATDGTLPAGSAKRVTGGGP